MKNQLKILQEKAKALTRQRSIVLGEIEKIKAAKEIPVFKKKYEGKYFKYRNCYGGSNDDERWWVYSFCEKVVDTDHYIGWKFEKETMNGEIKISRSKDWGGYFLLEIEITKEEFMVEWRKISANIKFIAKETK